MARRCELTGKDVATGNNVSHAVNRTRRRFLPNLQNTRVFSETLGQMVRFRICTSALRSVEKAGGIDSFLVKAKDTNLSSDALRLKKLIISKQAAA